jgi:hypothetical protein
MPPPLRCRCHHFDAADMPHATRLRCAFRFSPLFYAAAFAAITPLLIFADCLSPAFIATPPLPLLSLRHFRCRFAMLPIFADAAIVDTLALPPFHAAIFRHDIVFADADAVFIFAIIADIYADAFARDARRSRERRAADAAGSGDAHTSDLSCRRRYSPACAARRLRYADLLPLPLIAMPFSPLRYALPRFTRALCRHVLRRACAPR